MADLGRDDDLPPWWKGWPGYVTLVLTLALVVGGTLLAVHLTHHDDKCAAGIGSLHWVGKGQTRECVGITDETAYPFDPGLADITRRIAAENVRVRQQWEKPQAGAAPVPYVKIAVLTPMTSAPGSAMGIGLIRNSLEGAYTAQCRANECPQLAHTAQRGIAGRTPQVQLVIASEGRDQSAWPQVVDQLIGLRDGPHPLVAVTGLGISIPETREAANVLSDKGIPQIGSVLNATDMVAKQLFKVVPSNEEYAIALKQYVQRHPATDGTYLVYDRRDDNYVRTLHEAFVKEFGAQIGRHQVSFLGKTGDTGSGTPQLFVDAVQDICLTQADHVIYAGRDIDLLDFVKALSERGECAKGPMKPLTLLISSTGTGSAGQAAMEQALIGSKVTLVDASATDSVNWIAGKGAPAGFADFYTAYRALHFPEADVQNGYAIMNHDAVLTAVLAARKIAVEIGKQTVTGPDVLSELLNLHDAVTVPAASGTLTFDGLSNGWPHGKPVPIIVRPAPSDPAPIPLYTTP